MALIKWRDYYSTGVEYFDNEHKKLVGLINEMYEINRDHLGGGPTGKIINEVLEYTEYHFGHEERVFAKEGYADSGEHKQKHDELRKKARDFKEGFNRGEKDVVLNFYLFLREWLLEHILVCDNKYGSVLKEKNIKELLGE